MLQQLCDDASCAVLIENNGVTQKCVATPFCSNSIVFNERTVSLVSMEELLQAVTLTLSINGALIFSYLVPLVRELESRIHDMLFDMGTTPVMQPQTEGALGRSVFKRPRARSGRVNRGWQGGMVRGNQESDCVSYAIRMSMDAVTCPMENAHKVSGIVGKETRILGHLIERFMPFLRSAETPQPRQNILNVLFYLYFFTSYTVQAFQCHLCCLQLLANICYTSYFHFYVFYLFITIDMNMTWE